MKSNLQNQRMLYIFLEKIEPTEVSPLSPLTHWIFRHKRRISCSLKTEINVMVRQIIGTLSIFLALLPASVSYAGPYNCSTNPFLGSDLVGINAGISNGVFTVQATAKKPFIDLLHTATTNKLDFFIDTDQNKNTGDARPGGIRGADLRISCTFTPVPLCSLYNLPNTLDGQEQKSSVIPTVMLFDTLFAQNSGIQVSIPSFAFTAFDVFAFVHGGTGFLGRGTGNGDRCPEYGAFDTATGTVKIRTPAAEVDAEIDDPSGSTLSGWRYQTFGDQYRIIVGYNTPINVSSPNFHGRLELDTDRALLTGLVQTPFINPSPFNEIPSWGWDVAIIINGNGNPGDDPTPFSLDFGKQSDFIIPPTTFFPFYPFGEGYNDGRWYVSGNQLVLEGSLSQLDTHQWRYPGDGSKVVSRVPSDGRAIGLLFTDLNSGAVTDMIPKNYKAFDTGAKTEVPAIQWVPGKVVSGIAPKGDAEAQWDLTRVDAQLVGENLVVKGTLSQLNASWPNTGLRVFLDTDLNISTGTQISSLYGGQTIGADYVMWIGPRVAPIFLGYTTIFVKPDHSAEGHDNWLNINFSDPNLVYSPAQVIVTIPLSAIGNPKNAVRLYFGTVMFTESIQDIAPTQPLSLQGIGLILGGTAIDMNLSKVVCSNLSTRQVLGAPVMSNKFDCTGAGFIANAGDRITLTAKGEATQNKASGSVTGMTVAKVVCSNLSTRQVIGATVTNNSWDCVASGLSLFSGDRITMTIKGDAP